MATSTCTSGRRTCSSGADVVSVKAYPILDVASNGWLGGNQNGLNTLKGLSKADTRIVPGLGACAVACAPRRTTRHAHYGASANGEDAGTGKSAQEMLEARPTQEFDAVWGDPEQFIRNAFRGISLRPQQMGVSIV